MAQPSIFSPVTQSPNMFGGPKSQGIHVPTVPRIIRPKGSAPTPGSYGYSRQLAEQSAMRAGIDPQEFVRRLSYISGLNPTARSGGYGVAGLSPSEVKDINPWDPQKSLDYAAKVMAGLQMLQATRR